MLIDRQHAYVYCFQDFLITKYYKIGVTKNPQNRLHELQKRCPFDYLKVYCLIPSYDPFKLEKMLHDRFKNMGKQRKNEYYELSVDDLNYLDGLALGANQLVNYEKITDNR